jgi:hypothetical protein
MTQRHDAWQSWEWDVLKSLVHDDDYFARARFELPGRTENAIRVKMSNLRREVGIVPRVSAFDWRKRAREGSSGLKAAIERVHA